MVGFLPNGMTSAMEICQFWKFRSEPVFECGTSTIERENK